MFRCKIRNSVNSGAIYVKDKIVNQQWRSYDEDLSLINKNVICEDLMPHEQFANHILSTIVQEPIEVEVDAEYPNIVTNIKKKSRKKKRDSDKEIINNLTLEEE